MNGRVRTFGRALPPRPPLSSEPDWQQAKPAWIRGALDHALARPWSGWWVVDASRSITSRARRVEVDGVELAVWRTRAGEVRLGPDRCPHLGASLSAGKVVDDCLVCPWHGLAVGRGEGGWQAWDTHDDGVLVWVRAPGRVEAADRPGLGARPTRFLDAVTRKEARCDPEDVIANRLDPWHGAHFHPYSFARLQVVDQQADEITVRVVYRVAGPFGVEVDARFHCVDPFTIVMTIVDGEGTGSVVETHATPLGPGRTAVVEATLATSDRPAFWRVVDPLAAGLRPLVRWSAHRLWVDDAAYAERRYQLRTRRLD